MKRKNKTTKKILLVLAAVLIIAVAYYVTLPPISVYSADFWQFLFFIDIVVFVLYLLLGIMSGKLRRDEFSFGSGQVKIKAPANLKKLKFLKVQIILTAVVAVLLIIISIAGSELFNAKTYSSLIDIDEENFADGIAETEYVSDIALMDTASARIIGARTLGTLADLVSQYNVSDSYTQIAMRSDGESKSKPYKVAPLEYASFFKWMKNKGTGIPGYVKVDAVKFEAEFVRLDDGYIKYSPSAYFSKNLYRALRFANPTAVFGNIMFEVDDNGNPYWIASVMKPRAGLFGAMDVDSVVVMDARTGKCEKYKPEEAPDWVDIVYHGDLICRKYDWYGMLRGGYLNSQFGQTNCVVTTSDYGYKIIDNDVYIFTGVTSTSNDEANIGFILANSRTGKYKFFTVAGAEEYSAMSAAEGSVQQYRYKASFPSLINVDGEATYIMVLKDASGIVKMYSMVNVRNYNIVVTSDTQEDVFRRYKAALRQSYGDDPNVSQDKTVEEVTVNDIVYVVSGGETTVYLKTDGGVYRMAFDERILFVNEGDTVKVAYTEKNDGEATPATLAE